MNIEKKSFGNTLAGEAVQQYLMTNDNGLRLSVIDYGATITAIETPDREGKTETVVLGFDSMEGYNSEQYRADNPFFGCTVGRFANRIGGGKFSIGDTEYSLFQNDKTNHLHGGKCGFDKQMWTATAIEGDGFVGVEMTLTSPDMEEGYPGEVKVKVTFRLTNKNEVSIDYEATTSKTTHVNLTNHSYFNLDMSGSENVFGHQLQIFTDKYTVLADGGIPTGEIASVKGTALDFTAAKNVGDGVGEFASGYDHNFVLNNNGQLCHAATVTEPRTGRTMDVHTTQPGVQLYTSYYLSGKLVSRGCRYNQFKALCLETQHYPDSPNKTAFPTTLLQPGETYKQTVVHTFGVSK